MMNSFKHTAPDSPIDIVITPNDKGSPVGKLCDAEINFTAGPLSGLRLLGFAIWERRNGAGLNVTFPARQYSVNGERRSYALLRPLSTAGDAGIAGQDHVRDLMIAAWTAYTAAEEAAAAVPMPEAAHVR